MLKRIFGGIIYRTEYRALVCKAHFDFRGMDVHIDKTRCGGYIEHAVRELADHYRIFICLTQSRRSRAGLHKSAVDKKELHIAVRTRFCRLRNKPTYLHGLEAVIRFNKSVRKVLAENLIGCGFEVAASGGEQGALALSYKSYRNIGVRKRNLVNYTGDCIGLGDILFEKLHSCGGIEEKISDYYRRPERAAGIIDQRLL